MVDDVLGQGGALPAGVVNVVGVHHSNDMPAKLKTIFCPVLKVFRQATWSGCMTCLQAT